MAGHNYTKYDYRDDNGIVDQECMMAIRNCDRIVDIYIPFNWLHSNIKKEDVYRWVEIGNNTIFPATVEEVHIDNIDDPNGMAAIFNQFKGLRIRKKNIKEYIQSDAREVNYGILNYLHWGSRDRIQTSTMVYYNGDFKIVKYHGWIGFALDHELFETGECLDAYVRRIIEPELNKPVDKTKINSFKISIDCSKALSRHHKLAILSFYRFLWSNYFDGLVKDTLKIVDSGVDFWDALYYAMCKKSYSSYYGLLYQYGYMSMDGVIDLLKRGNAVNNSFTNPKKNGAQTLMSVSDFKSAVEAFKNGSYLGNLGISTKVTCKTDKLKTFTKGREYDSCPSLDTTKWVILRNNDFRQMTVLKKHFDVVQ